MLARFGDRPALSAGLMTILVVAALYGRTLTFEYTHTDDATMITENAATLSCV